MKRKNTIFSLASALCLGAAALAMTACSSEDNIIGNNQQQNAEARTYTVSIPADFSSGAQTRAVTFDNSVNPPTAITSFATSDKIYVYKKSPSTAWLSWNSGTSSYDYLSPSQNGASCNLSGTITGQFAEGDVLELYYNMNVLDSNKDNCRFSYLNQDGTGSGVADFAIATVKVKSIDAGNITFCQADDTDDPVAHFENLSSMFRFKFTDGSNTISVKNLRVGSSNPALLSAYLPMATTKCQPLGTGYIPVTLATATSDYIYMGIGIDESSNDDGAMIIMVEDADGKVYYVLKEKPTAGFKKGKYYYSTSPTTLTYNATIQYPTITWATPSTAVEPDFGSYQFDVNNFDFTLSGTSSYAHFYIGASATTNGTVRLNGLTATYDDNDYNYINNNGGDLTLDITGANTITCKRFTSSISTSGNLKLSGNGTLTVTAKSDQACGLAGANYNSSTNSNATTTALDVSAALAAPGYKVTRSARTTNTEGFSTTYTWTYTVAQLAESKALSAVTSTEVGWLIGSDGIAYAPNGALPTGVSAVAVIAYVGAAGTADASSSTYKGLALALADANSGSKATWCSQQDVTCLSAQYKESKATSDNAGIANTNALVGHGSHIHTAASVARNYGVTHPTVTSDWFLPSAGQWYKMSHAAGSYAKLKENASLQSSDYYWSSTEDTKSIVWAYDGSWHSVTKTSSLYVRSAIAF